MTYIRLPALLLAFALLAACSTYKSNSELTFETIELNEYKPVIPVGDLDVTADQLTYLGWLEAEVTKPSILHDDPTERQAAIVLGYLAQKEKGADAVIHVSYKLGGNLSPLTRIKARGQAVKINRLPEQEQTAATAPAETTDTAKPPPADNATPGSTEAITETTAPQAVEQPEPPAGTVKEGELDIEAELAKATAPPITDAQRMPYPAPESGKKDTKAKGYIRKEKPQDPAARLYNELIERDANADRRERIDLILNNIYYLEEKAEAYNDEDMKRATERMMQLLQNLRQEFEEPEEE